jgi:carbon monoxide dehydrogenase subunit G
MVHVERSFVVLPSVEEVVDYLKDFAHAEAWDPGTVHCTREGDAGPVQVGTTWHNVSKVRGKETELTYKLERFEPNRLTFVGKNKTATSNDDMTFESVTTGGTRITYKSDITFNGIFRLADPFMRKEFEGLGDETVVKMTGVLNQL